MIHFFLGGGAQGKFWAAMYPQIPPPQKKKKTLS